MYAQVAMETQKLHMVLQSPLSLHYAVIHHRICLLIYALQSTECKNNYACHKGPPKGAILLKIIPLVMQNQRCVYFHLSQGHE